MTGPRKVFIKSFGCQMNVYDSRRMADALAPQGYLETPKADEADVIILNTCHIREKAADKVYSELGRVRILKTSAASEGREVLVAVSGCVAQAEGEEILRRAPSVDLVVGPQNYHRLPHLIAQARLRPGIIDTEFPVEEKFDHLPPPPSAATRSRGITSFVTVQEGCDKFCTFCVVPYTRGAEFSRPVAKIVAEIRHLAESGVRDITLIGQNVNAFHGEGPDGAAWSLGRLVRVVAAVPGIARVRYTTSHPRDVDDDLIGAHRDVPELMPFVHLPVQSGSDRILAAMNRRHTAAEYLAIIERFRRARDDIAFSSDFIVGFPGETEDEFRASLALIDAVGFAGAYSFKYSPRPGTPGADMEGQVAEAVKSERLAQLQARIDTHQSAFNEKCRGRVFDILLEKLGRHPGQLVGRSPYLQPVQVTAPAALMGEVVSVRIDGVGANSLFGSFDGRGHDRAALLSARAGV